MRLKRRNGSGRLLALAFMGLLSPAAWAAEDLLPPPEVMAWVQAREAWRVAARAVADLELTADPPEWTRAVTMMTETDKWVAEHTYTYGQGVDRVRQATVMAQTLRARIVTERNAGRADRYIEQLNRATVHQDRFTAEVVLLTLEELVPADQRLPGWRRQVAGIAGRTPLTLMADSMTDMQFVRIPSGRLVMGTTQGPTFRFQEKVKGKGYDVTYQFDGPPHEVKMPQAFLMSRSKVTQGQWKALVGDLPEDCPNLGAAYPVYFQKWDDAKKFVDALRAKCPDLGIDLPTEEQWECACRGGTGSEYYFSLDGDHLEDYEWSACFDQRPKGPMPVAQKKPNPFGLYDMAGNVMEWCKDVFHPYAGSLLPEGAFEDPAHPETKNHVVRGSCWATPLPEQFRSAYRRPSHYGQGAGFRVVIALPDLPKEAGKQEPQAPQEKPAEPELDAGADKDVNPNTARSTTPGAAVR